MKAYLFLYLIISWCFSGSLASAQSRTSNSAVNLLVLSHAKLSTLSSITYDYRREVNYVSENYFSVVEGNTFLEFDAEEAILGFRFQFRNKLSKLIYNGDEFFSLNNKDTTKIINFKPQVSDFENLSFLNNSIVSLKNSLAAIIADQDIPKVLADTVLNQRNYPMIAFTLENKAIHNLGYFTKLTANIDINYKLVLDPESLLPILLIQSNSLSPEDYVSTTFTLKSLHAAPPKSDSWYFSSYTAFKLATENRLSIIQVGQLAPDWNLELFNSTERLGRKNTSGKYVLLTFWIKNCGYCIQAVPEVNTIAKTYPQLKVIGINPSDSETQIQHFYAQHKPSYSTVIDTDGLVTESFGIAGFPQLVLLDKSGIVIYTGTIGDKKLLQTLSAL